MLVDTDVLIWYLRGYPRAAQTLESLADLQVSAVTYIELIQGCRNKQEMERLKKDLVHRKAVILPISEPVSQRAMALIETHTLSGGLLLADALIAATALEHNLAVLTGNAKHFTPVEGLKIVRFEP